MIRILLLLAATASVLALAASDQPVRPTPLVHSIEPSAAKAGVQVLATGENLGKDCVSEAYLTQGEATTLKVQIKEQSSGTITFLVPASAKAGRFGFMVLTRGPVPALVEEPVTITVE